MMKSSFAGQIERTRIIFERQDIVYMAELCSKAKQWKNCLGVMRHLFVFMRKKCPDGDLSVREKNMFTACFMHLEKAKRKQWRTCYSLFEEEEAKDPDEDTNYKLRCIGLMKKKIENEIRELAKEAYKHAKYFISCDTTTTESRVFYMKMIAD